MADVIGQPLDRIDGRAKVTGGAHYAADINMAEMAYGVVVGASIARGRITALDTGAARRMPGVLLVMTHDTAPKQAPVPPDAKERHARPKPQLASDRVRYFGEPVAVVVARSFETARAAAATIRVGYAAEKGSYVLAEARKDAYTPKPNEETGRSDSKVGDVDAAFAAAPVKLDATYTTPYQHHNAMELHGSTAMWHGDKLVVYTAVQLVAAATKSIAATLKMPDDKVQVIAEFIGGGFGGKLPVSPDAILAALAARELKRPVKIVLSRQQTFHAMTHRPASIQRVRLGAERDGTLTAISHDALTQTARGDEFVEPVTAATKSLYAAPSRRSTLRVTQMDLPVADSMRAPGEAIGAAAFEMAMDELAEKLGMDPVELRLKNEPGLHPEKKVPYSTRALVQCLREGADRFGWEKRRARPGSDRRGNWLIGTGMAAASRGNFLMPAKARVMMEGADRATVEMDMTDIGTGSYTIFTQIAAELLGLPPQNVTVRLGHSDYPDTPGSGGSFGASSCGAALHDACTKLKAKLDAGETPQGLSADGEFKPGDQTEKYSQQSYGANFVEVGVDPSTGEVRLRRMLGVFAAGRILNAKTARSQLIGGMIWGVSTALHEISEVDRRFGSYVNVDLANYHVPVHADIPSIEAMILKEYDPHANVLGSKGIGELAISGAAAAVANAIYNACGARVRDYPITLDKILPALTVAGLAARP
jgi:xanthine dehydrogenase YagR molybdenum-binding subunit